MSDDDEYPQMPRVLKRWTWLAHWVGFWAMGYVCVPACQRRHSGQGFFDR